MKKITVFLFFIFLTVNLFAQVTRTLKISAGDLSKAISAEDKNTITELIIQGTIDARDFSTIRDSLKVLKVLDISGAEISSYSGVKGINNDYILDDYKKNTIPQYAFYKFSKNKEKYNDTKGYTSLEIVKLPLSIMSIGECAFKNCRKLKSINIPTGVTHIGKNAFQGCFSIESFSIPEGIEVIEDYVFSYCKNLKNINIHNGIKHIGISAFEGCAIETFSIPKGIDIIKSSVFRGCTNLKTINIPSTVTSIGSSAFAYCTNLTEIDIPISVTSIGTGAFMSCSNLKKINIHKKLKIIEDDPFWATNILIYVDPKNKNFTSLNGALYDKRMTKLKHCPVSTNLYIPKQTKYIYITSSFIKMQGIIKVNGSNPYYSSEDGILYNKDKSALLFVPINYSGKFIIPSSVKKLGWNAFLYCNNIDTIFVHPSVKGDFHSAFVLSKASINVDTLNPNFSSKDGVLFNKDFSKLLYFPANKKGTFSIPNTVTEIGRNAIQLCEELSVLNIPETFFKISNASIMGNSFEFNVDEKNPVYESIDGVLYNKIEKSLLSCPTSKSGNFYVPDSIKIIGSNAFIKCINLVSIYIPQSVTKIESGAFNECINLESISIPQSVTEIDDNAFFNCKNLKTIFSYAINPPSTDAFNYYFYDYFYDYCDFNFLQNYTLHIPKGSMENYINSDDGWRDFGVIIDDL